MFRVTLYLVVLLFCINAVFSDDTFTNDSNDAVALLQKYIQINTTTYNDLDDSFTYDSNDAVALLQKYIQLNTTTYNDLDDSFTYDSNDAVALLQKYIQLNTTTYNDLGPAVKFWKALAEEEGVTLKKLTFNNSSSPVLIIKWPGTQPCLKSVMLNSHMDVVPAHEEDGWSFPPFSGAISNGNIYGRGTQDMKSVSIQYFQALKRLKAKGAILARNVYMTLMPDEEVGGVNGMQPFLKSDKFKSMNIGIELDEGGAVDLPVIPVFYQDKVVWQIRVDCYGVAVHGSSFPPTNSTATGKCHNVASNLFAFRDAQYSSFSSASITDAGKYTSLNLNRMSGGTANNVLPNLVSLTFDIRPNTRLNEAKLQQQLESMIYAAGDNITITYISKNPQSPATVANATNPYWNAITQAAKELNITTLAVLPPGSTDARHVRLADVPAFGISPQPNTPTLLHAVDERLGYDTFLRGIDLYEKIINNLANIPGSETNDNTSFLYTTTEP